MGRAIGGGVAVYPFSSFDEFRQIHRWPSYGQFTINIVLAFAMALTSGAIAYLGLWLGAALCEDLPMSPAPFVGVGLVLVAATIPLI